MAKIKLGFDIGANSMKIAAMRGSGYQVETVRLPENLMNEDGVTMPHAFSQFLRQTLRKLHMPGGAAALALPPGQVICRLAALPEMTQEQLMLNLPYEFTDFIQGSPEEYFCDYAMCTRLESDEEGSMPMMAAVAAKRNLEDYIRMFARAGVRLKKLVPQEMALIEVCRAQGVKGVPEEYCFVDLGHCRTRITVVAGDRVQATRSLPIGGRDLDMAIADEMSVDAFLAGTYKMSNCQAECIPNICNHLAVEILKVVNFYQFTYRNNTLEGVYLVGGGAAMEPLRQAIESTVGLELLNPAGLFKTTAGTIENGIFAAGAAMGGV